MHFKSLKDFTLNKLKEKSQKGKDDAGLPDTTADRIAKMEKRIHGRTRDLEEKAQQIQVLSGNPIISRKNGDTSLRPHGPLNELTVEVDEESGILAAAMPESDESEEDEEKVKLVEINVVSAQPPPKASKLKPDMAGNTPVKSPEKETKFANNNDSLGSLFMHDDEEINPLTNLINTLPDVTIEELIDDLKEIKRIIKEKPSK